MRHWPITEACVVLVLGLILLVPLLHVTGGESSGGQASIGHHGGAEHSPALDPTGVDAEPIACWITVRSAHPLEQLRLSCEGETLLQTQSVTQVETSVDLAVGRTGLELLLEATWPDGTPESVVEVVVEPDTLDLQTRSVWAEDSVDDILSFQWP